MSEVKEKTKTLSEVERDYILQIFARCGFRRERTADLLGINRRTLYRKLKAYKASGYEVPKKGQSFHD